MIRVRDILAALAAIYLTRMAWDDPSESIAATAHLSFYLAREQAHSSSSSSNAADEEHSLTRYIAPVLLDVDGDGAAESFASPIYDSKTREWRMQILDLKGAANTDKTHVAPFSPPVLYESLTSITLTDTDMENVQPISMTTGHVMLKKSAGAGGGDGASSSSSARLSTSEYNGIKLDERNRHYFCGDGWHEASTTCKTPCPGGQSSECPTGERCFADTPCDIANFLSKDKKMTLQVAIDDLYVTPAGGLPSIFTLWSSGSVTMHSLTANATESGSSRRAPESKLKVLPMWETNVMTGGKRPFAWSDLHVLYLDAIDAGNLDGMLLVQAAVDFWRDSDTTDPEDLETMLFMTALDGRTGKIIWEADVLKSYAEQEDVPLPLHVGTSSSARRRSGIPFNLDQSGSALVTNCLHNYRRSLLTSGALPYLYWGDEDAVVQALHFETQPETKPHAKAKKGRHQQSNKHQPHRGKPNVVVSKTHRGLQVRSLRNGRSLCHVSLWHETLYADLNHDGVLDATFMMTGKHRLPGEEETSSMSEDEKWIYKLMLRVVEDEEARVQSRREQKLHHVCHSMTLSGIPPREELFTYPMCDADQSDEEGEHTEPGPPLAVEAMRGRGHDLVLAVNNGILHRVRSNGRKQWELRGRQYDKNFPTFEDGSYALIDRIDGKKVIPSTRPIIMTGDNSLALVAPRTGDLLSTAAFPQPVVQRPILMDFNGDGTTDVLVATADAYWGYSVHVRTGSSIFFRIAVGLLLMGVMLALLRNRFGPKPGKRSTDA